MRGWVDVVPDKEDVEVIGRKSEGNEGAAALIKAYIGEWHDDSCLRLLLTSFQVLRHRTQSD